MTGSKRVDHWTSGTVYECSEIAGSPQYYIFFFPDLTLYRIFWNILVFTLIRVIPLVILYICIHIPFPSQFILSGLLFPIFWPSYQLPLRPPLPERRSEFACDPERWGYFWIMVIIFIIPARRSQQKTAKKKRNPVVILETRYFSKEIKKKTKAWLIPYKTDQI